MGIIAKEGGQQRELLPAGNTHGVCYGIIDLGTQDGDYGPKHECCVLFEMPTLRFDDEDGKNIPKTKNKWYSISLHEKSNMGIDLTSWRGRPFTEEEKKGFDITNLIGANCLLNIQHYVGKDNATKDKISSITPLMQGMKKKEPESKTINYSIADNGFNFDGLPEWAVNQLKKSSEYANAESPPQNQQPQPEDTTDYSQPPVDDLPF